jgi:large subunit ribosomal protein L6
MSRIGKKPIAIPKGVEVNVSGQKVVAKGPKGQLEWTVRPELEVKLDAGILRVGNPHPAKHTNSLWGTTRTVLNNLVTGVSQGFGRSLEVVGTGYRVELQGKTLVMAVGFDHDVNYTVPDDVQVKVSQRPLKIELSGIDKQRVGQVAAEIRALKKPEPYHGKGIRYEGEQVRRKTGKSGA